MLSCTFIGAHIAPFFIIFCVQNKQLTEVATPFRRVGEEVSVDPRLQDNSFEAKGGSRGSWGEKANRDLKFTKGIAQQ